MNKADAVRSFAETIFYLSGNERRAAQDWCEAMPDSHVHKSQPRRRHNPYQIEKN